MGNHQKSVTKKKPCSITVYVKNITLFTSQTSFVPDSPYCPSELNSEGFKSPKVPAVPRLLSGVLEVRWEGALVEKSTKIQNNWQHSTGCNQLT